MIRKNLMWIPFALLLIFAIPTTRVSGANSQATTVFVYPPLKTIPAPGTNFMMFINISEVNSLYGYEIKMVYQSAAINATRIELPTNNIFAGKTYFIAKNTTATINATHSYAWFGISLLAPATPFTGSGVMFQISFTSTAVGSSSLDLGVPNPTPPPPVAYTKLSDPSPAPIAHSSVDGSVTVLPEFPVASIVPLFMVITLVAVTLKMYSMRKRSFHTSP